MSLFNTLIPTSGRAPSRRERSGADIGPSIRPLYEVKETDEGYGLTVYLPGVAKDGVDITAETDGLHIVGRRSWKQPESWTALYRESADAPFELILSHENAIDGEKIAAELRDGVLRVALPKAEAFKPRKITVG